MHVMKAKQPDLCLYILVVNPCLQRDHVILCSTNTCWCTRSITISHYHLKNDCRPCVCGYPTFPYEFRNCWCFRNPAVENHLLEAFETHGKSRDEPTSTGARRMFYAINRPWKNTTKKTAPEVTWVSIPWWAFHIPAYPQGVCDGNLWVGLSYEFKKAVFFLNTEQVREELL